MDITDFRSLATVLCMLGFFAVVWWAYGPSRRQQFEDAARLPFADDAESGKPDLHTTAGAAKERHEVEP